MSNQGKYGDLDDILSPEKSVTTSAQRTKRPTPALGVMQGRERPVPLSETLKAEKQQAQAALEAAQLEFEAQKAALISEIERVQGEQKNIQSVLSLSMPVSQEQISFELKKIEPELIDVSPENERIQTYLDELSLSDILPSIKRHGQQKPGMIRPKSNGRFELIEGSRRLAAVKLLNRPYMALVGLVPDADVRALGLIENQHKDVSSFEKAKAFERRIAQGEFSNWTQLGIALGISSSHMSRYKACVELDELFVRILPSPSDMPLSYAETIGRLIRKQPEAVYNKARSLLDLRQVSLVQKHKALSVEEVLIALKRAVTEANHKPSFRQPIVFASTDGAMNLKHSISRRTGSNKFELTGVPDEKLEKIRDFIVRTLALRPI